MLNEIHIWCEIIAVVVNKYSKDTWLMQATHAQETFTTRNCTKNMTQVHHSFLDQNNSPANHSAWLVSHGGQFVCGNRAVFYCVQETCTRKKLVPDWLTHVQVSGTGRLLTVSATSFLIVCCRYNTIKEAKAPSSADLNSYCTAQSDIPCIDVY